MADLPNRVVLFNAFADELLLRAEGRQDGRHITPAEVFTDGSDINLIGAAGSAMAEEVMRQLGRGLAALTLDGARGIELDRLCADRYNGEVVRKAASPARVRLTLARTSAVAGAGVFARGSRVQTQGGVVFVTTEDATFGASTLSVSVEARALNAGLSGNVAAGSIVAFVTQPFDSRITVTNFNFASGGDATESDAALRARARLFFISARRGTLSAVEFGALSVDGVRQATAEEEADSFGMLTGRVFLYVADANGQANASLTAAVELAVRAYRAAGLPVNVIGAVPVFTPIMLALAFDANVDAAVAFDRVRTVVLGQVNQTRPNKTLYRSLITSAARSVPGVIFSDGAVATPAGDVVPSSGQVIRTRLDLITAAP
jgi:uncharacterized phage protein gp47/JayE